MNITNKNGFPSYVEEWLKQDDYDHEENTISATGLMKPARMHALTIQNKDSMELDVADLIASRYGTAIHDSIEKVKLTNCIQEKRFRTFINGKVVTGKFDIMKNMNLPEHNLVDVKSTSVWSYIFGGKDDEYRKQLSVYRLLGRRNGYNVSLKAEIFMVFTDWSASKARKDSNYPQQRIVIKPLDLWDDETTEIYMRDRVKVLTETESLQQKDMSECTEEELWQSKTKYAVMKEGRKTAVKLYDNKDSAYEHIGADPNLRVDIRAGKVKRCNYCMCTKVCDQYTRLKEQGLIDE